MQGDAPPEAPKPLPCPSVYVTDAFVGIFPRDVMFVFLQRKALSPPAVTGGSFDNVAVLPVAEVHMSPESFKLFVQAAAGQLAEYERRNGEISLRDESGGRTPVGGSILQ